MRHLSPEEGGHQCTDIGRRGKIHGLIRGTKMTTKEKVISMANSLDEKATLDDAIDRLYLLRKIEIGIASGRRRHDGTRRIHRRTGARNCVLSTGHSAPVREPSLPASASRSAPDRNWFVGR